MRLTDKRVGFGKTPEISIVQRGAFKSYVRIGRGNGKLGKQAVFKTGEKKMCKDPKPKLYPGSTSGSRRGKGKAEEKGAKFVGKDGTRAKENKITHEKDEK